MSRVPPKFPTRPRLFARTPPAIFPPILGLFGLGLAWRRGHGAFGLPEGLVEALLGAVVLLYLFALLAYGAKALRRPGVVAEDFRTLPGRAGVAALSICLFAASAVLEPYAAGLATALLWVGLALHLATALSALWILLRSAPEARGATPVMHLTFVGFIVAPLGAVPLGYLALSSALVWFSLAMAAAIWAFGLRPLVTGAHPAPLRPLQAIHLAPAGLTGTAAHLTGQAALGNALALWGGLLLAVLLIRARWLTEAGFSGFWSAFTFPLAGYAGLLFLSAGDLGSEALRLGAGIVLVAATLIIPPIAFKVMQLWAKGVLAQKTNAAEA